MEDIHLGLDRITQVAKKMGLLEKYCPVITVTGTNGKGSCIATLEAIYLAAGYRVGVFQSPYLWQPEEQIRFQGKMIDKVVLEDHLKQVDRMREDVMLTSFESLTLAAIQFFRSQSPDLILLEVGMGGRRDAVNVIDPDLAIITNVGLEHMQWLGNTREEIAYEKAGILRHGIPLVYGEASLPTSVLACVQAMAASLYQYAQHYDYTIQGNHWSWHSGATHYALPIPRLAPHNVSTALMAITCLQAKLPVSLQAIRFGVQEACQPGRYQKVDGIHAHIYDVAHNPAGAVFLADQISRDGNFSGKTIAVFSMLKDKDIVGTVSALKSCVDQWMIAPLETPRAASLAQLEAGMRETGVCFTAHASLARAHEAALQCARREDRILVCGSFHTVSTLLSLSQVKIVLA